jgi:hypothetical protein
MFTPNRSALLLKRTGRDKHAREIFAPASDVRIAIVRRITRIGKTTVRQDSSASRGAAEETLADIKILIKPTAIAKDDRMIIDGDTFRVVEVHPRYTVYGGLDHYEVDLGIVV